MELILTIAPPPCAFMAGTTACVMCIVPSTLVSSTSFQPLRSALSPVPGVPQKKALFARPSMRPNCLTVLSARRWHCAASRMSVTSFSTLQPGFASRMRFSASSSFSAVRAPMATARAPSRAASIASLTPRPGPIPETIIDLVLE